MLYTSMHFQIAIKIPSCFKLALTSFWFPSICHRHNRHFPLTTACDRLSTMPMVEIYMKYIYIERAHIPLYTVIVKVLF